MSDTNPNQDTIYALAANADSLYAARLSGVSRSDDGGQTWHNTFAATPDLHGVAATALAVRGTTIIAGVTGGIAVSADQGATWQVRGLSAPPPLVVDLALLPADDLVLAATADDGVFLSRDNGTTWAAWNFGLFDLRVNCLAVAPDGFIFAGAESGIFRSHNGGKSWLDLPFPAEHAPVLSLAFTVEYMFAGTQASGLLYADHSGVNWAPVPGLDTLQAEVVHGLLPDTESLLVLTDQRLIRLAASDLSHETLCDFAAREALALARTGTQIAIGFADGTIEVVTP